MAIVVFRNRLMLYILSLHHPGTLTEVPNSGMPSREAMWQKAKAVLTPEEINEAEASTAPLLSTASWELSRALQA